MAGIRRNAGRWGNGRRIVKYGHAVPILRFPYHATTGGRAAYHLRGCGVYPRRAWDCPGHQLSAVLALGVGAIGVLKMLQARDGGGAFAGVLFTLAGVWLQAEELDVIHIRIWQIWPLALVLFGGYLVWQGLAGRGTRPAPTVDPVIPETPVRDDWAGNAPAKVVDATSTVSGVAILGGVSRGNNSRTFRGADLLAIMGGYQLDLRQAAINGDAVIDFS